MGTDNGEDEEDEDLENFYDIHAVYEDDDELVDGKNDKVLAQPISDDEDDDDDHLEDRKKSKNPNFVYTGMNDSRFS